MGERERPFSVGRGQSARWIGIQLRRKSSQKEIYRKSVVDCSRFKSKSKQIFEVRTCAFSNLLLSTTEYDRAECQSWIARPESSDRQREGTPEGTRNANLV